VPTLVQGKPSSGDKVLATSDAREWLLEPDIGRFEIEKLSSAFRPSAWWRFGIM
jgi:hypothetical protein